jgi:hypothetical protein
MKMPGRRSWKEHPITGVILVCIIIGAVVATIWVKRSQTPRFGKTRKIIAFCEETGELFLLEIETDSEPPYMSPKSGKKTAYFALVCQKCGTVYGMKETPGDANPCPRCGARVPTVVTMLPSSQEEQEEREE